MGWIIIVIIGIIIVIQISRTNKRNNSYKKSNNSYKKVKTTVDKSSLYYMSLTELLEQYKAHSLVPPLDSLTRWAYEKGEITSGKKSFSTLNDKDKETILRIGISIGNKRKREREEKIHNNIE